MLVLENPAPGDLAAPKPLLRGVSHQIAFFVALAGCGALSFLAQGHRAALAAGIYGASLATLFGVSALYHRRHWEPAQRQWMRRLDHSAIFLLIAGTFTPFCLKLQSGRAAALALVWGGCGLGILQSLFWVRAPKPLVAAAAVALSWGMTPILMRSAGPQGLALLIAGGVLYSFGAAAYALKRPDPAPAVFGYHEIFHAFVIAGSACHFAAVLPIIRALR
jgi:hemolysin III